ncbi:MAG: hypothetical protein ACJAT8_002554, partial [Cellvibrionaceae bacterium]
MKSERQLHLAIAMLQWLLATIKPRAVCAEG